MGVIHNNTYQTSEIVESDVIYDLRRMNPSMHQHVFTSTNAELERLTMPIPEHLKVGSQIRRTRLHFFTCLADLLLPEAVVLLDGTVGYGEENKPSALRRALASWVDGHGYQLGHGLPSHVTSEEISDHWKNRKSAS